MSLSKPLSDNRDNDGEPALVPEGGIFEGQVALQGRTRIDGAVSGSLRGPGQLNIGDEGRVEGRIECSELESRGHIIGPVYASSRAALGRGALFEGDLEAPSVEVDDDAVWTGKARIGPSSKSV